MIELAVSLFCVLMAVPVATLAVECWVGCRSPRPGPIGAEAPPFLVLMPAHNEAEGLVPILLAVVPQLRACDELIVIADNCTDRTAELARAAGAVVIERHDPHHRGKGYALDFARTRLANHPAEVVVVLDADCLPLDGALPRLASAAAARDGAVQGEYLLVPGENASALVRVSCFAFLIKNRIRQRALMRLAGAVLLQGSGMAFPRALFQSLSWQADSLVEDLAMGVELIAGGEDVCFAQDASFLSAASSEAGTAAQRRRWEHGTLISAVSLLGPLLATALRRRPRLLFLALDLTVPPTVLLILLSGLTMLLSLTIGGVTAALLALALCTGVLFAGITFAWLMQGRDILPFADLRRIPRYLLWKMPILTQFLTHRQREWVRTERQV